MEEIFTAVCGSSVDRSIATCGDDVVVVVIRSGNGYGWEVSVGIITASFPGGVGEMFFRLF